MNVEEKRKKLFTFLKRNLHLDVSLSPDVSIATMLDLVERLQPQLLDEVVMLLKDRPTVTVPSKTKFRCPVLNETLQGPCEARSCRFWVDYDVTDNCLQAFLKKYQQDTMSLTEISYVTQLTLTTVSRLHTSGLARMRQHAVSGILNFDDLETSFVLVGHPAVCVACESYMDDEPFYTSNGFSWCCKECVQERPETDVRIEARFGVETRRLLKFLTYRILGSVSIDRIVYDAATLQVMAQTTDLTGQEVESALRRHGLMVDKVRAEPARPRQVAAGGDRRKLWRFRVVDQHDKLVATLSEKYGLGSLDIAGLRSVRDEVTEELHLS